MWPLSTAAQQSLIQSHTIAVRAIAYGPYGTQEIPVGGGSITSDANAQTRRTGTLITDPNLWPVDPRSVIHVFGTEVQVDYGITLPGHVIEWVPLIRGLITEASRTQPVGSNASLPINLVDRAQRVIDNKLTSPVQTVAGATTVTEIRRLIQDAIGTGVPVTDLTGSSQVAAVLDIERDRWKDGVEPLAASIAAEVFFDPQGNGVIRPQPTLTDPVRWVITTGSQGTVVSLARKMSREQVYSAVTVSGQRSDGIAPVTWTTWDLDPSSPTYVGTYGTKMRYYVSPLLTTTLQCQTTGAAILARIKGSEATVGFSTIVNPALEAGDVVLLRDEETRSAQLHILDKVTVPLSPSEGQPLETRTLDLPAEQ